MNTQDYISKIKKLYTSGHATEHTYRGELSQLIEALCPDIKAINEPKRQAVGAPDYIITNKKIPVGYIEAKDLDPRINLDQIEKSEQMERYFHLENMALTNYIEFRFYRFGEKVATVSIGALNGGKLEIVHEKIAIFEDLIKDFCSYAGQTIKSSEKLAKMMAEKARLMQKEIFNIVTNDEPSTLKGQFDAFKQILMHDMDAKQFSDVYAQTIAYGMFAARLHDKTLDDFSRHEAMDLVPKSNPFLRKLFGYIAGPDLDDRLVIRINDLINVFLHTDIKELLKDFGKATQQHDPMIHFYETFLAEYDSKLRKSRGVYYTPEPVVNFIVRAVDDILKDEFNLPDGLADTSKVTIEVDEQGHFGDKRTKDHTVRKVKKEVHRVQVLDPATGTGTFLSEVIKHIYNTRFEGQAGIWSNYVEEHLIPRLHGFEILMAAYTMCHTKIELFLKETGYKPKNEKRLNVYLANSLEEAHPDTGTLFAQWLSEEANEANSIKRDCPVMVIMGNPPYSGESSNKGDWIMKLMEDYKKEPGGKEKLNERNPKWINDDYMKFIRYGQHFIEKNGEGILAFINPHGFLDNPTFRGMRWNLLKTYDKIYTIDLHGNSKKKETCPDGSKDENVFDIMQGVSINLFVKTGKKKSDDLGQIFHCDLYGLRQLKYDFLWKNSIKSVKYKKIPNKEPMYYMVQKNFVVEDEYEKGFSLTSFFPVNSVGIVTARDAFTIHETKKCVLETINDFVGLDSDIARKKYNLGDDVRDWKIDLAKKDLMDSGISENNICKILYRPFDTKYTYYTGKSKGFHCMPRGNVMQHFIKGENIGLTLCKQFKSGYTYQHCLITNEIIESSYVSNKTSEITSLFPLYLYFEGKTNNKQDELFSGEENGERKPNLNMEIVREIEQNLVLTFISEKQSGKKTFAPIDILDYIYAVLHSPAYREKYKEFLKIDFPRVPYPDNADKFWQLVKLGGEIRELHLMKSPKMSKLITKFPIDGDNKVVKPEYKDGKVFINDTQYFDNVPEIAWNFYIGGYQPAQKWLKDRKDRELSHDDVMHWQKIIVALNETDRLMKEIDKILII